MGKQPAQAAHTSISPPTHRYCWHPSAGPYGIRYYLARLIALASFFPFGKFLFGERGGKEKKEKKKKELNSYGCSRHLATLSNPEPARNILTQVTLPELTPSSRHASKAKKRREAC